MSAKKKTLAKTQGFCCYINLLKSKCKVLTEQNEALRDMLKTCHDHINNSHHKGIGDKVDILRDIHQLLRETANDSNDY